MLKSLVKASGIIAALVASGMAYAVGLGGINVTSALGQPLALEIEMVSVGKADQANMSAHLASVDAFKGAGIDYPYDLADLKFEIKKHKDGTPYIKVTSTGPVNEPFVNLLVELDWASGKLLREYTFLLDPPDYKAVQPKPEAVQPIAPSAAPAEPKATTPPPPPPVAQPLHTAPPVQKPAAVPAPTSGTLVGGSITVKHGDTLTSIAKQMQQPDVTLEQMLVALYRVNASKFDGRNMNRLRAGKILRRPQQSDLAHLSNSEAIKVIRMQAADWHAYRQKLAAASSAVSEQGAQQQASGKISTSVADQAPAAQPSAKEVLRLSKGEAPGDKATGTQSMQDKVHALEEEAVARNKELEDSKARIAMLEKNIKEMQRLLDLKAQPGMALQPAAGKQPASAPAPVAAASQPAAAAPQPVKPVAKPKPKAAPKKVAPPPPPPSLMDEIMGNPLYLGALAAIVLGLGALGLFAVRRRQGGPTTKPVKPVEDVNHIAEPEAPSPDTGDFTQIAESETEDGQAESTDEVDPISEADLFLNFGRDAQAEEVLKEALNRDPNNIKVQLKLLGIYADRKDINAFSSIARQVRDSGNEEAWQQAAAMGREVDPTNPMYGGSGEASDVAASEVPAAEEAAAVTDFELDEEKSEEPSVLDFDLGSLSEEPAATEVPAEVEGGAEEPALAAAEIGAEEIAEPAQEEAGVEQTAVLSPEEVRSAQEEPMDFDVTSTHPDLAALASEQPAATAEPDDSALDFDITMPEATPAAAAGEENKAAEPSLDDLIFDVTSTNPAMPAVSADEAAAEPAAGEAEEKPMDIGLGDISLNLDDIDEKPATPAAEGSKGEQWQEVATKLDLAKAYQEMGDAEGAREILEEVVRDGDDQQRATAQGLIDQLSA